MVDILKSSDIKTMTSREIAEFTKKRHSDVLRDIRKFEHDYISVYGNERKFASVKYTDAKGELRDQFELDKSQSLFVGSRYSGIIAAQIQKRWEELEKANQHQLPQTFAEALMLAAKQAEQLETQAKKIKEDKPKVDFADAVLESDDCISMEIMAKMIGTGRNTLFKLLRDDKVLQSKGKHRNIPYQRFINQGIFEVTERPWAHEWGSGITYITKVTPKGQEYIIKKYKVQ